MLVSPSSNTCTDTDLPVNRYRPNFQTWKSRARIVCVYVCVCVCSRERGNDVAPNGPVAGIKLDRVTELLEGGEEVGRDKETEGQYTEGKEDRR